MKPKNVLVVYLRPKKLEHRKTLERVIEVLKKYKTRFKVKERGSISKRICRKHDFIIIIGGDGTFLRTSHFIENAVVLGINADPNEKEGHLMISCKESFEKDYQKILTDDFNTIELMRLQAVINEKDKLMPCFNEIYIGHKKPYVMSRLKMKYNNVEYEFKCSGLLVGTPAGSKGWVVSAGGKELKPEATEFQFIAREPYEGRLFKHKIINETLDKRDILEVESITDDQCVIVDSLSKEYKFNKGYKIKITSAEMPLKVVRFK